MTTRRKLTLINGTMDTEGGIRTYTVTNSCEMGSCEPGWIAVPPLPFPDDDDNFDQAE